MTWLIIAAIVFSAVILWMLIETRGTLHLLWVIPLCLGLLVGTYSWYSAVLGYPTDQYKVGGKFVLLSYFVPQEEDKLVIWVVLRGEKDPKAIIIPYDPEEQKTLEQAAKKMAGGEKLEGEFGEPIRGSSATGSEGEGSDTQGNNKSSGGMLNFKELTVDSFLPQKDYVEEEEEEMRLP